jgi:hypothetical protein
MPATYRTATEPQAARDNLSRFVRNRAFESAEALGFDWVGVPDAPQTYQQLRGAFEHSQRSGDPLPISNLYCDNTIYLEPADNVAFRFWHDTSHCRLRLSFSMQDEWELALWHLEQLEAFGLGPGTTEHEMFRHDSLGQIILLGIAGRFPLVQGEFVQRCIEAGLDLGILHELRRVS